MPIQLSFRVACERLPEQADRDFPMIIASHRQSGSRLTPRMTPSTWRTAWLTQPSLVGLFREEWLHRGCRSVPWLRSYAQSLSWNVLLFGGGRGGKSNGRGSPAARAVSPASCSLMLLAYVTHLPSPHPFFRAERGATLPYISCLVAKCIRSSTCECAHLALSYLWPTASRAARIERLEALIQEEKDVGLIYEERQLAPRKGLQASGGMTKPLFVVVHMFPALDRCLFGQQWSALE
ncbi:hypothetical protein B0J12DRAFT_306476 [Macrophomina phaseolina]|uniref:Uncharacterized protein n=1 Tax=Macrophomina phaseolina TaxID=35725 RepID=A0ABQ8FWX2_9PEZI|nr:hypothetical protein B0J12DRAFT_306476 [Macrophomina phaseolina]